MIGLGIPAPKRCGTAGAGDRVYDISEGNHISGTSATSELSGHEGPAGVIRICDLADDMFVEFVNRRKFPGFSVEVRKAIEPR